MPQNFRSIPFDVYSAALLYSLGKLSIGEAAKIAANFSCTRDNSNANFHILQHKVRQVPAIFAIVALAQGLTQDSSDPFRDIFEVHNFILSISDFLTEDEYDDAGEFVVLGMQQSQVFDSDPEGKSPEAVEIRKEARRAAIGFINKYFTK